MIPIAKPLLGDEEVEAAAAAIRSGWVSQGPGVAAFEGEFAAFTGADHACAVSNCTTALHLALLSVGVGPGDEVITVSHSFIAGGNTVRQCGAEPVFVDIEEGGFNIDPGAVEAAVTGRTRAILCVHQMGMPCDLASLRKIADGHGLALIEDAACAVGSEIELGGQWQRIGQPVGDIVCFSFHPRKVMTTGEGGMLTTNDQTLDDKFRLWRQHSMSLSDTRRHNSATVMFEEYPEEGYNYRMTDIQAAIGRVQLTRLPGIVAQRRALARAYDTLLKAVPGIIPPQEPAWARTNWQSYCVALAPELDQLAVMQAMLDRGVATRRGIMCMHMEPAYASAPRPFPLPRSEHARDHSIILPLYAQMSEEEQVEVISALAHSVGSQRVRPARAVTTNAMTDA
jgi:dTDP-4-amino-4,6-dideoxygalactose transaminase